MAIFRQAAKCYMVKMISDDNFIMMYITDIDENFTKIFFSIYSCSILIFFVDECVL